MAFVSKVTAERRDLRELEHQMHSAEDLRSSHDDEDSPIRQHRMPLGIEPSGHFAAYVRCCAVVIVDLTVDSTPNSNNSNSNNNNSGNGAADLDGIRGRELWLGDQDGSISICLAVDGTKAKSPEDGTARHINQFPNTFPTAIGQVTFRDVWVCFQDGMIRAFDITGLKPRFEMKRHCGAITSIEVVESANVVATCSEDFLIYIWEGPPRSRQSQPSTELPKLIGKFAGHTNYVRAMVASPSGHHLFTGAADGTVRCYDLVRHVPLSCTDVVDSNAKVLGASNGAVSNVRDARDVFYLFLHDVGSILGVVSKTAVTIYVVQTSEVHCIFEADVDIGHLQGSSSSGSGSGSPVTFVASLYCESTGQLWVSRSDGLIAVYDLHNYELSGIVDAHLNTIVQLIQFATCAATVRVVAASGSKICGKDSNSDVQLEANNQTRDDMQKLVAVFKGQREKRQAAERDLATMQRQLNGLKFYDASFKERAADAMQGAESLLTKSLQLQRVRFFVLKRKHQNQAVLAAQAMQAKLRAQLMSRYFHDWFRFWCGKQTREAKKTVQGAITRMAERSLQSRYVQMGLANLRVGLEKETAQRRAQFLSTLLRIRTLHDMFTLWGRWARIRRFGKKRADLANTILRFNASIARSVSWTQLTVGSHNARTMAVRQRLATAICSIEQRNLMKNAFDVLMARRKVAARVRAKQNAAKKLEAQTENHVRSRYFGALLETVRGRRKRILEETTTALNARLEELEALINDPDVDAMTPEQVSDLITTAEKSIQEAQDGLAEQKQKLASFESFTQRMREDTAAYESGSKGAAKAREQAMAGAASTDGAGEVDASNSGPVGSAMEALVAQLPLNSALFSSGMAALNPAAPSGGKRSGSPRRPAAKRSSSRTRSRTRSASPSSSPAAPETKAGDEGKASATILAQALTAALAAYPASAPSSSSSSSAPAPAAAPVDNATKPADAPAPAAAPATEDTKKDDDVKKDDVTADGGRAADSTTKPDDTSSSSKPADSTTTDAAAAADAAPAGGTSSTSANSNADATAAADKPAAAETNDTSNNNTNTNTTTAAATNNDTAAAPVAAPAAAATPADAAPAVASSSAAAADDSKDSWPAQRSYLLSDFDKEKEQPGDEYRAAWERFATFAKDATTSLSMWQVLKHNRGQLGAAQLDDDTKARWAALEKELADGGCSGAVADLLERVGFAREHPELAAAPPPPPPPPKAPAAKRAARGKSSSRSASAAAPKPAAKSSGGSKSTAKSTSRAPSAKPSAKPAAKRAASGRR